MGRPHTIWKDAVEKNFQLLRRNVSVDLTFNREMWKELLVAGQILQKP